jgi:hypothetical protein
MACDLDKLDAYLRENQDENRGVVRENGIIIDEKDLCNGRAAKRHRMNRPVGTQGIRIHLPIEALHAVPFSFHSASRNIWATIVALSGITPHIGK